MLILILLVIIVAAVAAFALQNSAPITVFFLFWNFSASLAAVILLSIGAGIIFSLLVFLWMKVGRAMKKPGPSGEVQGASPEASPQDAGFPLPRE
jgi:uncharacterized integral membrane protein